MNQYPRHRSDLDVATCIVCHNVDFDDAHNALSDIEATERCFWELKKRGII